MSGVPVGFGETIEQVPQVFGLKEHLRKLDESEPDFDRANFKSAEMSATQLLAKFREEEKLGRMRPTTIGALREDYPADRIRVASMGAIEKPDRTGRCTTGARQDARGPGQQWHPSLESCLCSGSGRNGVCRETGRFSM